MKQIDTADFIHKLYEPVFKLNKDILSQLYIGAKGGHVKNMGDGPITQIWKNMTPEGISQWQNKVREFVTVLPHNMNYTPAPRTAPDAKKKYTAGITCLWADIDNMPYKHWEKTGLSIFSSSIMPNIVVDSGWGVHLYWLLDQFKPFDSITQTRIQQIADVERLNGILAWLSSADAQCADVSHLMRLPGSVNCKSDPYKPTSIWYLKSERYDYNKFSTKLLEGANYVLSQKTNCDSRLEEESNIAMLRSVMSSDKTMVGGSAYYKDNKQISTNTKALYKEMIKEAEICPYLDCVINDPMRLSYKGWFTLACAINKKITYEEGYSLFRELSLPGNTSGDPEGEIQTMYKNVNALNYMPSNSINLNECLGCKIMGTRCKNLLTRLTSAMKRT